MITLQHEPPLPLAFVRIFPRVTCLVWLTITSNALAFHSSPAVLAFSMTDAQPMRAEALAEANSAPGHGR